MALVVFYEKPGCINNTRQKKLLMEAGHKLEVHNLLEEKWKAVTLKPFFGDMPIAARFNSSAPDVKNGIVIPEELDESKAMALMVDDPILIRRPLMKVGEEYRVGFDENDVDQWIGLSRKTGDDLESCPRTAGHSCD